MLIIGLIVFTMLLLAFTGDNKNMVMDRFCALECKKNIQSKYKFCC